MREREREGEVRGGEETAAAGRVGREDVRQRAKRKWDVRKEIRGKEGSER